MIPVPKELGRLFFSQSSESFLTYYPLLPRPQGFLGVLTETLFFFFFFCPKYITGPDLL